MIRGCFIVHAGDPDRDIAQAALRLRPPLGELNESFFPTVRGLVALDVLRLQIASSSSPILSDRLRGTAAARQVSVWTLFGESSDFWATSVRRKRRGGVFEGYTPRHPVHLTKAEAKLVVDICRRLRSATSKWIES